MADSNLANLPLPPPPGSIQFFDGYFPALGAGKYSIQLDHTVTGNTGAPEPFSASQRVIVQAPQFAIDPGIVQSFYPPNGASDIYNDKIPYIALTDPSLPWERGIIPDSGAPNPANPISWMALLILAESEVVLPDQSNNPVRTTTVQDLLNSSATTFKPQLDAKDIAPDVLNSQCQSVVIPGAVFNAVVPTRDDLPFLTHCRGVNTLDEGEQLLSILLANRMPQAAVSPAAAVRYFAQLVSLEGFADYMGPNASPIPNKPNSQDLKDVQMVSLYNWSFTSLPQAGESFGQLMAGLVASQQASQSQQQTVALQLPLPPEPKAPQNVQDRLNEGFVPLKFVSGTGEESFAWYRGPFVAKVPRPLPQVGNPPTPVRKAATADELMIYLAEQGIFDMSYAAAWNLGRNLALADPVFASQATIYRNSAASAFARYAQRASMSHFAPGTNARQLLAADATRMRFTGMMAEGLGHKWNSALGATRTRLAAAKAGQRAASRPQLRFARKQALHPRAALASPQAVAAVSTDLEDIIESVSAWLARMSLLYPVPFSHLVPDPRMLPVESIRFFYLDPGWTDALVAGALSIAMHTTAEVSQQLALLPAVKASIGRQSARSFRRTRPDAAINPVSAAGNVVSAGENAGNGISISGVLIRSALVSGWPNMLVTATVGGAPLNTVRDDCPSNSVRLCLFDGIPDTVTLAQPYQGVQFGAADGSVSPRCVTAPAFTGSQLANGTKVARRFRPQLPGSLGGVLQVQALAADLAPAAGIRPFASGATVNWNGNALPTTFVSANQLDATVPANLVASVGAAAVTVTSNGATSLPQTFTIDAPLEIDAINPALVEAGVAEFTLTVDGVGFAAGAVVKWNGTPLTTKQISVNQVTARVQASLVAAPTGAEITVSAGGGTSNAVTLQVVSADPILNTIAPNIATVGGNGFTLTVNGTGFASGAVVQWNGALLTTAFVGSEQLKATVPKSLIAATGSAQVTVQVNGAVSNAVQFTIAAAVPTIGSLFQSVAIVGAGGFELTVRGVNFGSDSKVNWGTSSLTPDPKKISPEQVTVTVPANLVTQAGMVNVTVVSGGTTSNRVGFLVTGPQPAVGLLAPPSVVAGAAGFTLKVYGGFGAGDFALQLVAAPEMQTFPTI